MMNIVIIGQGAIGLLYYKWLDESLLHQVSLLPSARLNVLPKSYTFTSLDNVTQQVKLTQGNLNTLADCDLILCCVKSYQVNAALTPLLSYLNNKAVIVLCHNGMGVYEELPDPIKQTYPILSMLCTHGSKKGDDLSIAHTGLGHSDIGWLNRSLSSFSSQDFLDKIHNTFGDLYWHDDIAIAQWHKLAINCVINPITTIKNINNGDLLLPEYANDILDILHEVALVAQKEGIGLDEKQLLKVVISVAQKTALNSSSMRCDILARRASEIDYISGYVHRLGLKHNISTPHNTFLWQRILSMEKAYL